ncbi:MAG: site-specific integrase [Alphaproteobacteria bacterium]|nr:site-specific integrase [Alphaproteobacteria bacterium]
MARTARDTRLETRTARTGLKTRREPYWRTIHEGLAIGYRKGRRGGFWIARLYDTEHGRRFKSLGIADDIADANGTTVLDFRQAQEEARGFEKDQRRIDRGLDPRTGRPIGEAPEHYSVRNAIDDYQAANAHRGQAFKESRYRIEADILPVLGDVELAKLTTRRISDWHRNLSMRPARRRTRRGEAAKFATAPKSSDDKRQRQASANRTLTILKAALNQAFKDGKAAADDTWRRVRPFPNVDAAVVRFLSADECVRLVNRCEKGMRRLVQAAILTGCRYAELTGLAVTDINLEANTLTVRTSKSGKPRHVVLTDEAAQFFKAETAGKPPDARVFLKSDGTVWGRGHQQRPLVIACREAKITPAINFHILRHVHGSALAMKGVPFGVIAKQLGHADTRMTEKHYAHLAPNYVADTIRSNFPTLGIVTAGKVEPIGARRRSRMQ